MKDSTKSRLHHTKRRRRLVGCWWLLLVACSVGKGQAFSIVRPPCYDRHTPHFMSSSVSESRPATLQSNTTTTTTTKNPLQLDANVDLNDVARPTANGGFTHTTSSKAKISAANAGKVPWNKGKSRSEETKRKIAAGVQRRNRERFLQKLADQGLTEAQYEANQRATKREQQAQRAARRTAKGGYRPTEATKQKISAVLKQKFKEGAIRRAPRDPSTIRRGYTHSEETRRKISASLKQKWANDEEYRERMKNGSASNAEINAKISATLRARWQDPEFRDKMLIKLNGTNRTMTPERRKKISESIKAKWQQEEYRRKITKNVAAPKRPVPAKRKLAAQKRKTTQITALQPITAREHTRAPPVRLPVKPVEATIRTPIQPINPPHTVAAESAVKPPVVEAKEEVEVVTPKPKPKKKAAKKKDPVDEVRSDLYDLLFDDDDSLDEFDPYGLDDN